MKIILDRIDKDKNNVSIACFEDEKGDSLFISEADMPQGFFEKLFVGAIVECKIEDKKVVSASILYDETKEREEKMKSKLKNLFNKRKS